MVDGHLLGLQLERGERAGGVLSPLLHFDQKRDTLSYEVLIQHDAAVKCALPLESEAFALQTLDRLEQKKLPSQELLVLAPQLAYLLVHERFDRYLLPGVLSRRRGCGRFPLPLHTLMTTARFLA